MAECNSSVLNASTHTLVLAVDLGEDVLALGPQYLARAIQSPKLGKAIESALMAEAKRLIALQKQGKPVTGEDGVKVLQASGKAALSAGTKEVKHQIEGSAAYKDLRRSLDTLVCSVKKSPVGVWVNENEKLLIIVASGLAIGGAAAMYQVQQGDQIAAWGLDLAKAHYDVEVIGGLKIGASEPVFVPSKRRLGLKGFVKADFQGVKANLDVKVLTQQDELASVAGNADIVVPVSTGLSLSGTAAMKGARNLATGTPKGPMGVDYDFGLGMRFSKKHGQSVLNLQLRANGGKKGDQFNAGGSAGLNYNTKIAGMPAKVGASGNIRSTRAVGGGDWSTEYGVTLGIEISL